MGVNFFDRDARDLKFVLFEYLDPDEVLSYEKYSDFDRDDLNMIVDEALKLGREVLGPTLQDGDREGCRYEDGRVETPGSFCAAWRTVCENGWLGADASPEYGGQGLPHAVSGLVSEILYGANLALMGYAGLTLGNGRLIEDFGADDDRRLFVRNMYTGRWGGAMCLTEPDAGSDVGSIRTRAAPDPDADDPRIYRIEGVKRFITGGKQDLTENIVHLVLARIQGAPEGTKGISLFIVPEIWVEADGSLGPGNDVFCSGIEHKMGTHGLSTCSLSFGENNGCRGILLGEPETGMAKMFQMMNEARLATGNQSLALAASAYDSARAYARERIQGRPFTDPGAERIPIIGHEDVRRMLMDIKSGVEAMRAFIARAYLLMDRAENETDSAAVDRAQTRLDLYTPLIKGFFPDLAYELIAEAIQVLGGVGFCREFPVEQYARDVKIESIWEGTTYIQSLDLVGRKMMKDGGRAFGEMLAEIGAAAEEGRSRPELDGEYELLARAAAAVGDMAAAYPRYFAENRMSLIPLTSTRLLASTAEVVMAGMILDQAELARAALAGGTRGSAAVFYRGKMETARHFCHTFLPRVFARQVSFGQESTAALDMPDQAF
jgi:alkylation response protein AidB-like acyl-CoA dehydrogenase